MACRTASVARVADKSKRASEQLDILQASLNDRKKADIDYYFKTIEQHLQNAGIHDARKVSFDSDMKIEYTSEFSLDAMAQVIVNSIDAAAKATDSKIAKPATSPEAIEAYKTLVNSVAQAAKSTSTASASVAFSMTRLSPGVFTFLYAKSTNIKDKETFGHEAVSCTAIYYSFYQSIDDLKKQAEFEETRIDLESLTKMKYLQVSIIDELQRKEINLLTFYALNAAYQGIIDGINARIASHGFRNDAVTWDINSPTFALAAQSGLPQDIIAILHDAVAGLEKMGDDYRYPVFITEDRLSKNYF